MVLSERAFEDYFGLLLPILIVGCFIIYVKRSRPNLILGFTLALFNRVHFKLIQKNIDDRNSTILFWCSVFLQGIYLQSNFLKSTSEYYLIYIILLLVLLLKYIAIKLSIFTFQKDAVLKDYHTIFFISIVNIGLFSVPVTVFNIIYLNVSDQSVFNIINSIFISSVVLFILTKVAIALMYGLKQKISYLHLIVYLCTLEILPMVVISYFFYIN